MHFVEISIALSTVIVFTINLYMFLVMKCVRASLSISYNVNWNFDIMNFSGFTRHFVRILCVYILSTRIIILSHKTTCGEEKVSFVNWATHFITTLACLFFHHHV
jgi:hypothetical protein